MTVRVGLWVRMNNTVKEQVRWCEKWGGNDDEDIDWWWNDYGEDEFVSEDEQHSEGTGEMMWGVRWKWWWRYWLMMKWLWWWWVCEWGWTTQWMNRWDDVRSGEKMMIKILIDGEMIMVRVSEDEQHSERTGEMMWGVRWKLWWRHLTDDETIMVRVSLWVRMNSTVK